MQIIPFSILAERVEKDWQIIKRDWFFFFSFAFVVHEEEPEKN